MRQRCTNIKDAGYPNYGGRGIEFRFESVTEACLWIVDNLGLHADMELDRINNDGHYEPGNLRWATRTTQSHNKRTSRVGEEAYTWGRSRSPYAWNTTKRLLISGVSPEEMVERAKQAVAEKRKGWRGLQERLVSLGYMTS